LLIQQASRNETDAFVLWRSLMQSLPLSPLLVGESLELRPLEAVDFAALYGVACDP